MTFYRFIKIEIDHYILNYEDKVICQDIGKKIKEYENNTGIKINKISIYKDKNARYSYKNLFVTGDINITGFATDWSDVDLINYYNNINLKKVEKDKEIEENFANNDWTRFDSREQIIFKNNTIHLCVY